MANDIDKMLVEAQLRSKFNNVVLEFVKLQALVETYVDIEEVKADSNMYFEENEINALEMIVCDTESIEQDLKRVSDMLGGLA